MKKLAYILVIIITGVVFYSCSKEPFFVSEYFYINDSGHDIAVSWKEYSWQDADSFEVKDGETYIMSVPDYSRHFGTAEEVAVIFDNSRVLTFYLSMARYDEDNIFNPGEQIGEKKINRYGKVYYYRYTFTPEMYERAVPIEEAEDD